MTAAILQGVPATTLDTDIWVDLPSRQYVRLMNLCLKLGGAALAKTVYALPDDNMVNFLFSIDGLKDFATEYKHAVTVKWNGLKVPVLPLEKILKSKETIRRAKDLAHLPLLHTVIRARNMARPKSRQGGGK